MDRLANAAEHLPKEEVAMAIKSTTPPAVVVGFTIAGHPLADWVQLATLVFIVVQILIISHTWYKNNVKSSK